MMDFIYNLYKTDNFTIILTVVLVLLIIAFVVVFFWGKKDKELEETRKLQKIELDTFKEEPKEEVKLEVNKEVKTPDIQEKTKEEVNTPLFETTTISLENINPTLDDVVNVVEFKPEEKQVEEDEEIVKIVPNISSSHKDHEEEEKPISISELPPLEEKAEDVDLSNLVSIKDEIEKIQIPEVKEESKEEVKEEKVFKPSQVFSSVYTTDEQRENKIFASYDNEDEDDMELPSLKK